MLHGARLDGVSARDEGLHETIDDAHRAGDRPHLQGVGDDRAGEPEALAQQPGRDVPAQRHQVVRVEGRREQVARS